ncbi:MAG: hypothetical protein ACRDZ3_17755 [Acidimicrobiia bacterium]
MRGDTTKTYQATDVARRSREVLDSGRAGGALIRDKDGVALLLVPAEEAARRDELADLAADYLRLLRAVAVSGADVATYGGFGWVAVFNLDDQRDFAAQLGGPLLVALSGGPTGPVRDLIEDWRVTAETWADEALRADLLEPSDSPLSDVAL